MSAVWLPSGRPGSILEIDEPCEGKRSRARNAGDGRRRKATDAFLLQVTADLPNPAEYETDRHRDRDFENHHHYQCHGMFLSGSMPLGCPCKGYRTVFHAVILANSASRPNVLDGPPQIRRTSSCLSRLADGSRRLHTNIPSVPGQRETNDTGLAATNKGGTRNGA